jgi:signal transduction histidine kinase
MARGETRHVLVLSSTERPFAPQSGFADALMRDLIKESREPIQFYEVSVQPARASGEPPDASTAQRIRSAFGSGRIDLVMTVGGPAATLAQQFRQELFPATPMVIAGVDRRFVENGTFTDNETTVATEHDPALMIDEILRLLPGTRTVMVVIGASQVEQFWLQQMQREFRRFGERLQFTFTNELSYSEILDRARSMPGQSAIFYALLSLDGKGEPRVDGDTLGSIHAVANAPLFSLYGMGRGTVGGPLLSTDGLSHITARVALRVLAGDSPGSIKTPIQRTGQPTYDARELRRWKIDEDRLPVGSVVLFREPTNWRAISLGALAGGIPVVAFVLFVGLARRRRAPSGAPVADEVRTQEPAAETIATAMAAADARQETEAVPTDDGSAGHAVDLADLRRELADVSKLSGHLMQAHEQERAALTTTLHEDVCQRMAALTLRLHNLQGGDRDAELGEIRDRLATLVGEIAAVSDRSYQRLKLQGLTSAGRGFCEELSAQYDVAIHFRDDGVPRALPSDIALALFRVLQEAAVNAVVHSAAREFWVSVRGTAAEVRLQVLDRGVGFDMQGAVPRGVGLVAIRERLKLVNGDSVIESRPGAGTRVEAWVPLYASEQTA